jgi:5-methyltetrahydrofolate--homocysteine methyltransferase
VLREGNELVVFDPEDPETELERFVFPRQPGHDRLCLADFYRPLDAASATSSRSRSSRSARGHRVMAQLEQEGEFAEQLFTHGLGVQVAEGMAEWLHAKVRRTSASARTRAAATRGATPPCPSSPSTRRSTACSTRRRSA